MLGMHQTYCDNPECAAPLVPPAERCEDCAAEATPR